MNTPTQTGGAKLSNEEGHAAIDAFRAQRQNEQAGQPRTQSFKEALYVQLPRNAASDEALAFAAVLECETATLHAQLGEANAKLAQFAKAGKWADDKLAEYRAQIARLQQRQGELVGALKRAEQKAILINNNVAILAGGAQNKKTLEWLKELQLVADDIADSSSAALQSIAKK